MMILNMAMTACFSVQVMTLAVRPFITIKPITIWPMPNQPFRCDKTGKSEG